MPPNRQSVPRPEREAEILEAAQAVFAADGFEQASMAAIARCAGMTSANVHYYFATKDALFASVVRRTYDQLFDVLDALPDSRQRLHGYVRFHLDHHSIRADFQAIAARSGDVAGQLVRREAWLARTVADLTDDDLDGAAVVAVVTGLIEAAEPRRDSSAVLDHAVGLLIHKRGRSVARRAATNRDPNHARKGALR